jgi:hypothetical protein
VSSADRAFEKTAHRLEEVAARAEEHGKAGQRIAPLLDEDAEFLRRMTPSKVKERLRSDTPPKNSRGPGPRRGTQGVVVLAAAFALGVLIAKLIEWRSYAT